MTTGSIQLFLFPPLFSKDLKVLAFSYLSVVDLRTISIVNKEFNDLSKDNYIWKKRLNEYCRSFQLNRKDSEDTWDKRYAAKFHLKDLLEFFKFIGGQDKEGQLNDLFKRLQSKRRNYALNGFRFDIFKHFDEIYNPSDEVTTFARKHLSKWLDKFEQTYQGEHKFYKAYKHICLTYRGKTPFEREYFAKIDFSPINQWLSEGKKLSGMSFSLDHLHLLFFFFQEDPELGKNIKLLMEDLYRSKSSFSTSQKILFALLLASLLGLALGARKIRHFAAPIFRAKL